MPLSTLNKCSLQTVTSIVVYKRSCFGTLDNNSRMSTNSQTSFSNILNDTIKNWQIWTETRNSANHKDRHVTVPLLKHRCPPQKEIKSILKHTGILSKHMKLIKTVQRGFDLHSLWTQKLCRPHAFHVSPKLSCKQTTGAPYLCYYCASTADWLSALMIHVST